MIIADHDIWWLTDFEKKKKNDGPDMGQIDQNRARN